MEPPRTYNEGPPLRWCHGVNVLPQMPAPIRPAAADAVAAADAAAVPVLLPRRPPGGRRCPCRLQPAAAGHAVAVHHGHQRDVAERRPRGHQHPGPHPEDIRDGHPAGLGVEPAAAAPRPLVRPRPPAAPGRPVSAEGRAAPPDWGPHPGLERAAGAAAAAREGGPGVRRGRAVAVRPALLRAAPARAAPRRPRRGLPGGGPAPAAGHDAGPEAVGLVLRGVLLAGVGRHAAQRAPRHVPGAGLQRPALPVLAERADGPRAHQRAAVVHCGRLQAGRGAAPRARHAALPLRPAAHRALRRQPGGPRQAGPRLHPRRRPRRRPRPGSRTGVGRCERGDVLPHPADRPQEAHGAGAAAPRPPRGQPPAAAQRRLGGGAPRKVRTAIHFAALRRGVPVHLVTSSKCVGSWKPNNIC